MTGSGPAVYFWVHFRDIDRGFHQTISEFFHMFSHKELYNQDARSLPSLSDPPVMEPGLNHPTEEPSGIQRS